MVPDITFYMPWSPGFVVKYEGVNECYGSPERPLFAEHENLTLVAVDRGAAPDTLGDLPSKRVLILVYSSTARYGDLEIGSIEIESGRSLRDFQAFPAADVSSEAFGVAFRPIFKQNVTRDVAVGFCNMKLISGLTLLGHTLRLMDCKNVNTKQVFEPETRQVRRARERKGGPQDSFWVLDIPGSPHYWEKSTGEPTGIDSRLHIVRGHFRTYTEDRPHVSGWVGPMWISSHARGNAELGLVEKDYNLSEEVAE